MSIKLIIKIIKVIELILSPLKMAGQRSVCRKHGSEIWRPQWERPALYVGINEENTPNK